MVALAKDQMRTKRVKAVAKALDEATRKALAVSGFGIIDPEPIESWLTTYWWTEKDDKDHAEPVLRSHMTLRADISFGVEVAVRIDGVLDDDDPDQLTFDVGMSLPNGGNLAAMACAHALLGKALAFASTFETAAHDGYRRAIRNLKAEA